MNPTAPRCRVLVRREAGLAGEEEGEDRWSLDHLFLDQEAIPTIVEVKTDEKVAVARGMADTLREGLGRTDGQAGGRRGGRSGDLTGGEEFAHGLAS